MEAGFAIAEECNFLEVFSLLEPRFRSSPVAYHPAHQSSISCGISQRWKKYFASRVDPLSISLASLTKLSMTRLA